MLDLLCFSYYLGINESMLKTFVPLLMALSVSQEYFKCFIGRDIYIERELTIVVIVYGGREKNSLGLVTQV